MTLALEDSTDLAASRTPPPPSPQGQGVLVRDTSILGLTSSCLYWKSRPECLWNILLLDVLLKAFSSRCLASLKLSGGAYPTRTADLAGPDLRQAHHLGRSDVSRVLHSYDLLDRGISCIKQGRLQPGDEIELAFGSKETKTIWSLKTHGHERSAACKPLPPGRSPSHDWLVSRIHV